MAITYACKRTIWLNMAKNVDLKFTWQIGILLPLFRGVKRIKVPVVWIKLVHHLAAFLKHECTSGSCKFMPCLCMHLFLFSICIKALWFTKHLLYNSLTCLKVCKYSLTQTATKILSDPSGTVWYEMNLQNYRTVYRQHNATGLSKCVPQNANSK